MKIILLLHREGKIPVRVISSEGEELSFKGKSCTSVFWELGVRFPHAVIGWCEEGLEAHLQQENWPEVFHHDLIMASYAVHTRFLPDQIGYVDRFPFINVKPKVLYASWQMSRDIGGIKGETLLQFKSLYGTLQDFDYLLNSIGKLGQQNGLFCYSTPLLVKDSKDIRPEAVARQKELFSFVAQQYNAIWKYILLICLFIYERKLPFLAYFYSLGKRSYFQKEVDLSGIDVQSRKAFQEPEIDVIVPTLGRPEFLFEVLKDLSFQTLLPSKVILVEQNSDPEGASELDFLRKEEWPFIIVHHFLHETGACNARNIALKDVTGNFVFFADDDIRFPPALLESAMEEMKKFGLSCVNMNCRQEQESAMFSAVKQWGAFGAGTSIVASRFAKEINFSSVYEYGYGEDLDYGMQLRNAGCDIIYHPALEILHLKAPRGGFRSPIIKPWEEEEGQPKPSPTVMAYVNKYYTPEQKKGYKIELFFKFYSKQAVRNPWKYFRLMNRRWKKSNAWAERLLSMSKEEVIRDAV